MTKRAAKNVLLFLALFTVLFGYYTFQAHVDYEFEDFFPAGNEEVEYFNNFRNNFETDNDFVMLAIVNIDGVFDSLFLTQIQALNKAQSEQDKNPDRKVVGSLSSHPREYEDNSNNSNEGGTNYNTSPSQSR